MDVSCKTTKIRIKIVPHVDYKIKKSKAVMLSVGNKGTEWLGMKKGI